MADTRDAAGPPATRPAWRPETTTAPLRDEPTLKVRRSIVLYPWRARSPLGSLPYAPATCRREQAGDRRVVHDHEGIRDLGEAREEARHQATLRTVDATGCGTPANLPAASRLRYSMSAPQPASRISATYAESAAK